MKQQIDIETITLKAGAHKSLDEGACVMELVSCMANEPWSDNPKCACPVLAAYARRINDRMDDEYRQKLKPLIPKLLNSADPKKKKARYEFLAHQAIAVFLPLLTDAIELPEISAKLREFKIGDWISARDYINSVRPEIKKKAAASAASAAYASAYAAADAAAAAAASAASDAAAAAAAAAASAAAYASADAAAAAAAASAASADAASAASADAAAASAAKKQFWLDVRNKIWQAGIDALERACDL